MFRIVKRMIDEFNPYSLLPDSPPDEFDRESRQIAGKIKLSMEIEEIAIIIATVFSNAFNEKFEARECMEPDTKIYKLININRN